jgi:hypothetical protein
MSFAFSEQHLEEYHSLGFTVFRGIVPPALVRDLRRETDRGRQRARERHGPQAQRFQPVAAYELDQRPFADFRELPDLRDALARILGPAVSYADLSLMGVLIEPAERPWCTRWHRDWRDNAPYLDFAEWRAILLDRDYLNQSNCALYEDHSLWVVPGSHVRGDLPSEAALFPTRPIVEPDLGGGSEEECERAMSRYVRAMARAQQVHLEAGDFCLYRNSLWHLGAYVPYARRATLHDFVDTPEFLSWRERMSADMERRKVEGRPAWEWSRGPAASRA